MKNWVKEKLDIISDLYPAERIEKSKERYRSVWKKQTPPDRYPFVYGPLSLDYYDTIHSPENRLRYSLDEHIQRGEIDDDFIPSIFPGCRQITIPDMFSPIDKRGRLEHGQEKSVINLSDIDRLPAPSIEKGTFAHQWLETQTYLLEETEGCMPIHVVDMQSPVEVCAKMWGYDAFFIAAYEEPEYCHRFMGKLTEAFILFWEAQQNLLGDCFVGNHLWGWNWAPKNNGVSLSADGMVMVSADFFEEFFLPSIRRIGEHFGGATVHSCGDFSHVMSCLMKQETLVGIHAGQMPLPDALKAGFDDTKVFIGPTNLVDAKDEYELIRDHKLNTIMTIFDLWPSTTPSDWTASDLQTIQSEHNRIMDIVTV